MISSSFILFQGLRQFKENQTDTEILMSALSAMQEKNAHLENSLSAETRIKLDLFSALGEAKRQLEIRDSKCIVFLIVTSVRIVTSAFFIRVWYLIMQSECVCITYTVSTVFKALVRAALNKRKYNFKKKSKNIACIVEQSCGGLS